MKLATLGSLVLLSSSAFALVTPSDNIDFASDTPPKQVPEEQVPTTKQVPEKETPMKQLPQKEEAPQPQPYRRPYHRHFQVPQEESSEVDDAAADNDNDLQDAYYGNFMMS